MCFAGSPGNSTPLASEKVGFPINSNDTPALFTSVRLLEAPVNMNEFVGLIVAPESLLPLSPLGVSGAGGGQVSNPASPHTSNFVILPFNGRLGELDHNINPI